MSVSFDRQRDRVGIEFLSLLNDNPMEIVKTAALLDCRFISLALAPMYMPLVTHTPWSLRDDKNLRRDVALALRDHNVAIAVGECFMIRADVDFRQAARADLEIMRELNIPRANIVSLDTDLARTIDQCGAITETAASLGMGTTLEFGPNLGAAPDLQSALKIIRAVGSPNFRLALDSMHFFRSGATVADLAALDHNLIGHIQLCDAPRECRYESYVYEACYERLAPGEGELPLKEFLDAAPRDTVIGLEIPMLARAQKGMSPQARLEDAVATTKTLLDQLD